ncbi:Diguanylate cyclase with PAS/PAC and GAF sensors (modular protein) [Planktothrix serta PCC 8927]|uniref:Diguanylate cyclase with PAS/PAC and GAF sensors (Modular protein) n=1 Tax=Planktothrix serta PCC 8927 TaxID=671068 RepID=A0A7Z9BR99_9CYAN|nr:diguanylate cyclase [Planktothrix serta]VXD18131.1 Diguanylate cyclase with PAS/PAC and GAF sensors (modular protein) [Planktothrix serta PCC 8927]
MLFGRLLASKTGLEQALNQIMAITQQIHQPLEFGEILDVTVTGIREILRCDRAVIYRFLPEGDGVVAEESVSPESTPIIGQLIYDPCFQAKWVDLYRQGRISSIEDVETKLLEPCYKQLLQRLQISANLVVPILLPTPPSNQAPPTLPELWGLVIVHQCRSPRKWQTLEIQFLQQVALQLAIAIQYRQLNQPPQEFYQQKQQITEQQTQRCECSHPVNNGYLTEYSIDSVSIADLKGWDRLQTPIWIFDIENLQMWWANNAALHIWNAPNREELLQRNFKDISEATRIRLNAYLQQFQHQETITETWTFYPEGQPISVRCTCSGILIETGRMAMLVEGITEVAHQNTPEILRSIEVLHHTTVMISLYTLDGVPLMQNPAAMRCYGDTLYPNLAEDNVFVRHFVDPNIGETAIVTAQSGAVFSIETQVYTLDGIRCHWLDVRCTRDPVTGHPMLLVNEKDITQQQAAIIERQGVEQELRWKEALLRSMTDTSNLAFFVVDNRTDNILYFNHRFCEIWGIEHLESQMLEGVLKNNDIIPDCIPLIADVPAFAESCKPLQNEENRAIIEDEIAFNDSRTIRRFSSQIRDNSDRYFGRLYIFEDISDRIAAQKALKISEDRWQYALEGNGDGVWDWQPQTNQVFFSRRWKEMLGFAENEIGNTLEEWKNRVHPDDIEMVFRNIKQHFQGETKQYITEHQVLCKDGTYKWILDRGQVLSRSPEGLPLRMIGTHTDITERKAMEETLRERDTRLSLALEASRMGTWDWNILTNEILYSDQLRLMFGLSGPYDRSYQAFLDIVHPEDRELVNQSVRCALSETTHYNVEFRVILLEGAVHWVSNKGQVYYNESGQAIRMIGVAMDITAQKQAEINLRESEERYRSVIAAMCEGIVLQQADGQIAACNQSAERILGLSSDQMRGRTSIDPRWRAIQNDGSDFPGENHPAMVTLRTGKPQYNVIMGVHKPDGDLTWISINSQPLFHPDQPQPYAVVTSFSDITVRKQAEESLKQQAERERMIYGITQRIRQSLDLDEILQTTVAEVRQFLQTDRVIIYRFNPDWSGVVVKESVSAGTKSILNREITDSYFVENQGKSYEQNTIKVTPDIYTPEISACHLELLEKLQVRAKLVVPILQTQGLWGLLVAHHCSEPREWHPLESELLKQLATQLAIAIQQSELHHQLQLANQQLQNLAMVDKLTQIANRRCFDDILNQEWYRLIREQRPLSLLLGDIDYFKQYNDTYGHSQGDICLQQVAQALQKGVQRSTDLVARYGGEEFVIILPYTDQEGALQVADKIQEVLQQFNLPHRASAVADRVTISIGICTLIPTLKRVPLDLINAADEALYQAKTQGRNRAVSSIID